MDMRINSILIKSEREKRAWSQEHLASVTGLGLRTINRIEKSGVASQESMKAIASVFEIKISQLRLIEEPIFIPAHLLWLKAIAIALISPIRFIVKEDSVIKNTHRLIITFAFLMAAMTCYMLKVETGVAVFMIAGILFEFAFWYRLTRRPNPQ